MNLLKGLVLCTAGTFILTSSSCPAAGSPGQVDAGVEIYELPQAEAVAWQKTFEESAEPDPQKLVSQLRAGATSQARTIGLGQRTCALDEPSTVATVEQYRYPTAFETKDGFATPSSFEITNVGCTMTLKITVGGEDHSFAVETDIRDVALLLTQRSPPPGPTSPAASSSRCSPPRRFRHVLTRLGSIQAH